MFGKNILTFINCECNERNCRQRVTLGVVVVPHWQSGQDNCQVTKVKPGATLVSDSLKYWLQYHSGYYPGQAMSAKLTKQHSISWRAVISTAVRILTFRASRDELLSLSTPHLIFGLICTWIVGVGRYYDNPRVGFFQHLGVGSVVYVFVFSLFLWLIVWPLRPARWRYLHLCAFVALVSPPAILYAIPVERFFELNIANFINGWFLAIVATWRVALLIYFLRRSAQLNWFSALVAALLPLTVIVVVLATLNLERAVFSIMGGLSDRTSSDLAFAILQTLTLLAILLFVPLLLSYLTIIVVRLRAEHRRRSNESRV